MENSKKIYTFPPHDGYGEVFGLAKTLSGTYVTPGWHLVPDGTTRDQIKFHPSTKSLKPEPQPDAPKQTTEEWTVNGSKPGVTYQITHSNSRWDCTCPAKTFHRGDCKHIKAKKNELIPA